MIAGIWPAGAPASLAGFRLFSRIWLNRTLTDYFELLRKLKLELPM